MKDKYKINLETFRPSRLLAVCTLVAFILVFMLSLFSRCLKDLLRVELPALELSVEEEYSLALIEAISKRDIKKCDSLSTEGWGYIENLRQNCHSDYHEALRQLISCREKGNFLQCLLNTDFQTRIYAGVPYCNAMHKRIGKEGADIFNLCSIYTGRYLYTERPLPNDSSKNSRFFTDDNDAIEPCQKLATDLARQYCISQAADSIDTCTTLTDKVAKSTCYYRMAQKKADEVSRICTMVTTTIDGIGKESCLSSGLWRH